MLTTTTMRNWAVVTASGALSACGTVQPQDADANSQAAVESAEPDDRAATPGVNASMPAHQNTIDSPAKTPAERAAAAARKAGQEPPPAMITDPHPEPVPQ